MIRVRGGLMKVVPAATGVVAGAILVGVFAGGAVEAAPQDPAVQAQVQAALNIFRLEMQNQHLLLQNRIDTMEREVRTLRLERDTGTGNRAAITPIPADPIPGVETRGRLVSQKSESEDFVLTGASGRVFGRLGMTTDGPALLLLDVTGRMSAVLVATPTGAELRMVDEDGILQTVLPQR